MSILKQTYTVLLALLVPAVVTLISCDAFHEDLQPCPQGVRLRFVYDYNMEYANAFPSQVDCLTLLVYDNEGHYLKTLTAGRPQIADENWLMYIDLPAGSYNMLAYGGMDCSEASFRFSEAPAQLPMRDLEVYLPEALVGHDLHPLYYGSLEVTVPPRANDTDYTDATVYMMKDTNNIRVLLANENGLPALAEDFVFTLTDNNTRFNYLNDIISTEDVIYTPWIKGSSDAGLLPDNQPATVAWAEFSVPRLMDGSDATLTVTRVEDGRKVLSIPLINILLLLKSEHYKAMEPQEFLDRESRWNLTFILTNDGLWAGVSIIINDWVVRINNISDL